MDVVVVMGVAGTGKSTLGRPLADELGAAFVEADDLHDPASVAKMAAGVPLEDADRLPWLDRVAAAIAEADGPVVVACSALRRSYRDRLRAGAGRPIVFVHLDGSAELLGCRLEARAGHFMPASLLPSQLETLEPLGPDEPGVVLDAGRSVADLVTSALVALG